MIYKYYNQNNYANVPYPSTSAPNATVKSGGCGVACAAMIVCNMTDKTVDPKEMAAYSIKHRARVSGGTDIIALAKALTLDYGLMFQTTNNESVLLDHLRSGNMAVANVGGNRPGYTGVFSGGGHFIVCAGIADDSRLIVLDPSYYAGKFSLAGRVGKVKVDSNNCLCDISVLASDTSNRNPSYCLFTRKEVEQDMKIGMEIPEVKVIMNGKPVDKSVILTVDGKDTSYMPVVALREEGMSVEWDAAIKTVIIKGGK